MIRDVGTRRITLLPTLIKITAVDDKWQLRACFKNTIEVTRNFCKLDCTPTGKGEIYSVPGDYCSRKVSSGMPDGLLLERGRMSD